MVSTRFPYSVVPSVSDVSSTINATSWNLFKFRANILDESLSPPPPPPESTWDSVSMV